MLKKGIVRKTFLFTSLLITLVTLISFVILYSAMPDHYRRLKESTFEHNLSILASDLQGVGSHNEYVVIMSMFSEANNAVVFSFDEQGAMLPTMSTPFMTMQGTPGQVVVYGWWDPGMRVHGQTDYNVAFWSSPREMSIVTREAPVPAPVPDSSGLNAFVTITNVPTPTATVRTAAAEGHILSFSHQVDSPMVASIVANTTLQPIDEARGVLLSLMPYVLLSGIIIGLIFAWIYARQISKPILQISGAAQRMQSMEPGVVCGVESSDELGALSRNLDSLYQSLLLNIRELESEMQKANSLERSKTEMLQSASHELKTPIAALGGMLEGMADNVGVYKDTDKYLAECIGETHKLTRLVDEILIASKSDILEDALDISEVSPDEIVHELLEEYALPIREGNLRVALYMYAPDTVIFTDRGVLRRALSNIFSNAARYTATGGELRVTLRDEQLIIENQCDYIGEDELAKLFEPFYTRSASRDKSQSGTGLGLYIAKRSLERLGIGCTIENGEIGLRVSLNLHGHYTQATH